MGIQTVNYPSKFFEVSRESNIPYIYIHTYIHTYIYIHIHTYIYIYPSTNTEYGKLFYQSTPNPVQPSVKHYNFVQTHNIIS